MIIKIIFISSEISKKAYFRIMEVDVEVMVFKESRSIFKIGISPLIIFSETHFQERETS